MTETQTLRLRLARVDLRQRMTQLEQAKQDAYEGLCSVVRMKACLENLERAEARVRELSREAA